jgi:Putative Se/S carrier protein-like
VSSNRNSGPEPAPRVGLLSLASTNLALKNERALKDAQIPCAVIPTPPDITSECGISLLLREEWVPKTEETLAAGGCEGYSLVFPFESAAPEL